MEVGESLELLLGRSRGLVGTRIRLLVIFGSKQRLESTHALMNEVICVNGLPIVCTISL